MGRTFLMRRSPLMGRRIVAKPPQRVNVPRVFDTVEAAVDHRMTTV